MKPRPRIVLDPRLYCPAPIKSLTDEEIQKLYPGVPIDRTPETPEKASGRMKKAFQAMRRESRAKARY